MTAAVSGNLYIYGPDALCNELRPHVEAFYPGASCSQFCSDGSVVFCLSGVPYPVEQVRCTLASWYRWSLQRGSTVYWSWVPPVGTAVFPGGTLFVRCRDGSASAVVQAELQSRFPGVYLYTFSSDEGWVSHDVDIPCPGADFYEWFVPLMRQVPGLSFHWRRWFDRVLLPDGTMMSIDNL